MSPLEVGSFLSTYETFTIVNPNLTTAGAVSARLTFALACLERKSVSLAPQRDFVHLSNRAWAQYTIRFRNQTEMDDKQSVAAAAVCSPLEPHRMARELRSHEANAPIRILIVDDQRVMRQGLRLLIENNGGMRVVGEAGTRAEALALTSLEQPDVILLELDLDGSSSLDFLPDLVSSNPGGRVIVLTRVRSPEMHRQAVCLGATGLVLKEQAGDVLLRAIERVHAGEAWLDHRTTASVIAEISRPRKIDGDAAKIATLTERERELITVVCEGLKSKQIAQKLFISEATVRSSLAGKMRIGRTGHTPVLLTDGRVLIAGGRNLDRALDSTEVFDPVKNAFMLGPQMNQARAGHSGIVLMDGTDLCQPLRPTLCSRSFGCTPEPAGESRIYIQHLSGFEFR